MLEAHVSLELGIGLMTERMWLGDYERDEPGEYVFYRDRGTRDANGKPERDILSTREAVSILLSHYIDKSDEYANLLGELEAIMKRDDYSIDVDDLKDRLAPWLEPQESPAPA